MIKILAGRDGHAQQRETPPNLVAGPNSGGSPR
jgi:hypothetical protein